MDARWLGELALHCAIAFGVGALLMLAGGAIGSVSRKHGHRRVDGATAHVMRVVMVAMLIAAIVGVGALLFFGLGWLIVVMGAAFA